MTVTTPRPEGTSDDPIRREDNLCAYDGCPQRIATLRISHSGAMVAYCTTHARQAHQLFDRK